MRFLRLAAMVVAIVGGYVGLTAAPVSATPLSAASAGGAVQTENSLAQQVQYYRRGYGRRFYRPVRRYYRPYRAYRPYRRIYRPYRAFRPRVVCRVRYTPYGPRRVCFRRF